MHPNSVLTHFTSVSRYRMCLIGILLILRLCWQRQHWSIWIKPCDICVYRRNGVESTSNRLKAALCQLGVGAHAFFSATPNLVTSCNSQQSSTQLPPEQPEQLKTSVWVWRAFNKCGFCLSRRLLTKWIKWRGSRSRWFTASAKLFSGENPEFCFFFFFWDTFLSLFPLISRPLLTLNLLTANNFCLNWQVMFIRTTTSRPVGIWSANWHTFLHLELVPESTGLFHGSGN